jgi:sterol desaturase/sphingolipid hydroxylase (fatty acid hydroxylase superfamily)
MDELVTSQVLVVASALVLLWALETWLPSQPARTGRTRHAARNLTLGLANAAVLAVAGVPLLAYVAVRAEASSLGLLHLASLPPPAAAVAAVLLLDGWMYVWHRANHRVPFLWRFHRVHHTDPALDVTSAVRFHTGEIALSAAARLAVVPLLGVSLWQVLLYDTLLLPVVLFHHSNVRFPERWDAWMRLLVVSPAVHRIHHSRVGEETDSNFASVFSFWDRLAGTFRHRRDADRVSFGLEGFDSDAWQTLRALFRTPFAGAAPPRPGGPPQAPAIPEL